MKKIIYAAMLLLGLSIMVSSCGKDNSTSIVGTWKLSEFEFFYDNAKLNHGANESVYYLDKSSRATQVWSPTDYIATMFEITIKEDKSVYFMGQLIGTIEDANIKMSDGYLIGDEEFEAYAYGMSESGMPEWKGADGQPHKLVVRQKFSKR